MKKACLVLLAGIYAPQLSSFASHSDLIPLLVFALLAGFVTGRLAAALLAAGGYLLFVAAAGAVIDARIAADNVGDSIMAEVTIADFPQRRGATLSFVGHVQGNPWVPEQVRVTWFEPPLAPELGDTWRLELRLRRPRGNSNPGVFDYESWLFRNQFAATGYVVDSARNERLDAGRADPVAKLRQRAVARIGQAELEPGRAAVLAAISVGARHLVSREQWDRYAMSGTSHLMAISGLHVGMVAFAAYLLARGIAGALRLHGNHHRHATGVALLGAMAYALVSGLGVPAQRATLMIGLAALALLGGRLVRPFRIIAAACIAVAVMSPLATLAPGFKLSFAAVLILLWVARRHAGMATGLRKPLRAVTLLAAVQVTLLTGLLPLTVLLFGRLALVAPAVNLLAVPVFSFATVPLTFGGLLPGDTMGASLLLAASWTLGLVERLIDLSLALPMAGIVIPELRGPAVLLLWVPVLWTLLPPGWPGRGLAWLGLLAVVCYVPPRPAHGCFQLDVLDVGQGLAIVVTTHTSALLYDTGPAYRGGGSAAEAVVLPFLASRGIDRLDRAVVSHADLDHAGGIDALAAAIDVADLLAGEPLVRAHGERRCDATQAWTIDGIGFAFLYPRPAATAEGNEASCVLQVSAGEHRVLLTGDIEQQAEAAMLQSGVLGEARAVVVPHHGSRTSSSAPFVAALRPELAIVSAAWGNRWGLPHDAVVSRWQSAGATVLNTATDGAVGLHVCETGGITAVSRHRALARRIWHE